ncbi:uncharacterized protein LOC144928558 isoform X2 [Branchiostoma floridae x Branchiostoma belcheri]
MRQLVLTAFLLGSLAMTSASDVDECASNNGGCAHTCTNSVGSFSCSCRAGYVLNADGLACDENPGLEPASNFGDYQGYRIWSSDRHQRLSYSDARDVCRINGGTLVMIKDSATQTFILDHLNKPSTKGGRERRFWIGLDDLNDENVFLWNDGTPLGDFDRFKSTAPHKVRDCVTLWKKPRRAPRWYLKPCANSYPYICQMDFDACPSTSCDVNAVCTDNPAPALDATCSCNAGYEGDGTSCSDIDACLSTSCDVNAVCTDNPAPALDATCNCNAGYEGDGTSCSDINACLSNPCDVNAMCTDNPAPALDATCTCNAGYEGDGTSCSDIDACPSNPCDVNAMCTDNPAPALDATCACNAGYEGDGRADGSGCSDIDACLSTSCDVNAVCTDNPAPALDATCTCNAGYEGDGTSCSDINACLSNPCDVNAMCTDNPAPALDATCTCNAGYEGDGTSCSDINACLVDPCDVNAVCTDNPAPALDATCSCNAGYEGDGTSCSDVDECASNNGGCVEICINTYGSFRCSCPAGYVLNADGISCDDDDECSRNNGGCQRVCTNTEGSFSCSCNGQEELNADGFTCDGAWLPALDASYVQESSGTSNAAMDVTKALDWSFATYWTALPDYFFILDLKEIYVLKQIGVAVMGDTTHDVKIFKLQAWPLGTSDWVDVTSHTCRAATSANYLQTFSGFRGTAQIWKFLVEEVHSQAHPYIREVKFYGFVPPADVDECASNNGGCVEICINTYGSFRCSCPAGYVLNADDISCDDDNECSRNNGGCQRVCTNTEGSFICSCNGQEELNADGFTCDGAWLPALDASYVQESSGTSNAAMDVTKALDWSFATYWTALPDYFFILDLKEIYVLKQIGVAVMGDTTHDVKIFKLQAWPLGTSDWVDVTSHTCRAATSANYLQTFSGFRGTAQIWKFLVEEVHSQAHPYIREVKFYGFVPPADVDECASNNGGCVEICINTYGSFRCSCPAGYALNADGISCDDDNECSRNNGGCQRVCTNTEGSFICSCNGQEELNADGFSCDGAWLPALDASYVQESSGTPWVRDGVIYDVTKALDWNFNTFWNPLDTRDYYFILDLKEIYVLKQIGVAVYGDTTHDVKIFKLQALPLGTSDWVDVTQQSCRAATSANYLQTFSGFRGTAQLWKFLVVEVHRNYQPWIREVKFYGFPSPAD